MNCLSDKFPDINDALNLPIDRFGGLLIFHLNSLIKSGNKNNFHLSNICGSDWIKRGYPREKAPEIEEMLAEGWNWLFVEGLLIPIPADAHGWHFVTRRGRRITNEKELIDFRQSTLFPTGIFHPLIVTKVKNNFVMGEYDIAVFLAFKTVEVSVREAGKFQPTVIGVDLMGKAFHPENGPLSSKSLPLAERNAIAALFTGAMGYAKNPQSHREVNIADPSQAIELIGFASHLMRIIDLQMNMKINGSPTQ